MAHYPILLETAAQFVSGRTESHRSDHLDQCAWFLPVLFGNNNDNADRIAKIRYGCPDKLSARQVGIDLLDALLYVKKSERRYSALHAYAWYLKTRSNMQKLSVIVTSNRQMALRRVHAIEDRALAMTFIDAILFARARLNDAGYVKSTSRSRNFWMNSIWIFMPNSGIELLLQRAKSWPSDYVKTCWPELCMIEDVSMLQCNKNAVREAVIRENLRINQ